MKKINVLLLIYKLEVAGAERVVASLAKGLDRKRFNPIVGSFKNGALVDEIRAAGIPVHLLEKKGRFDLTFPYRLLKLMKEEEIDIIHAHTFSPNFWGCVLGKLNNVAPIITTEHNVCQVKKRWQRHLDRVMARFPRQIVAVSEQVRQSHIMEGKIDPEKLITIHNGIEGFGQQTRLKPSARVKRKKALGLNPAGPLIINVARLHPQKGHVYLLKAVKSVVEAWPEAQCLIVGEGALRKELEEFAKRLSLDAHLFFTGFRSDIFELLQVADISVWASLKEGFPITLLEAMAAGKPVVATDVGGNKEAILSGVTGIVVPPRDPGALSEAILRLLRDSKLAQEMGENGRRRFEKEFTSRAMISKVEALYCRLWEKGESHARS